VPVFSAFLYKINQLIKEKTQNFKVNLLLSAPEITPALMEIANQHIPENNNNIFIEDRKPKDDYITKATFFTERFKKSMDGLEKLHVFFCGREDIQQLLRDAHDDLHGKFSLHCEVFDK